MTTEELEKFKLQASKMVEDLVNLYNQTVYFSNRPDSQRTQRSIYRCCKVLRQDAMNLAKQSRLVYAEAFENNKEAKLKQKEQKKATVRKTIKENPNAHKPPKRSV